MANYKPVKIMFDLDDEYHAKLYEYLKKRTNGSSYIRTLLHQDMNNNLEQTEYKVVNEQNNTQIVEQPDTDDISDMKTATVKTVTQPYTIKINNIPVEDNDIFVEDLI